jgi:anti-sigma regulatory factor (Ser/Thr protein kinase)
MPLDQLSPGPPGRHPRSGANGHPTVLGATDLPAEPHQVKNARHWLRDLLGKDHPVVFEVELLGCELITNAILHSDSAGLNGRGRPGNVSILVLALDQAIRVEVSDAGSARNTPHLVDAGTDAISGRGLRLLREMTDGQCGTWIDGARRIVWFELDHTEAVTPGGDRP